MLNIADRACDKTLFISDGQKSEDVGLYCCIANHVSKRSTVRTDLLQGAGDQLFDNIECGVVR